MPQIDIEDIEPTSAQPPREYLPRASFLLEPAKVGNTGVGAPGFRVTPGQLKSGSLLMIPKINGVGLFDFPRPVIARSIGGGMLCFRRRLIVTVTPYTESLTGNHAPFNSSNPEYQITNIGKVQMEFDDDDIEIVDFDTSNVGSGAVDTPTTIFTTTVNYKSNSGGPPDYLIVDCQPREGYLVVPFAKYDSKGRVTFNLVGTVGNINVTSDTLRPAGVLLPSSFFAVNIVKARNVKFDYPDSTQEGELGIVKYA